MGPEHPFMVVVNPQVWVCPPPQKKHQKVQKLINEQLFIFNKNAQKLF